MRNEKASLHRADALSRSVADVQMGEEPIEAAAGRNHICVVSIDDVDVEGAVRLEDVATKHARFLEGIQELLAAGSSDAIAICGLKARKDLKVLDFLPDVEFRELRKICHVTSLAPLLWGRC